MKPIKSLPLKITLLLLALSPFAYIISAYTYSYAILSGDLAFDPNVSTKIYDINGEIISELFDENRTISESGAIPVLVKHAFLAAEDRNFYLHSGFDLPGIIRAVLVDMFSGEMRQGGSTITQQLVKQLYTKGEKTIHRKIIEIFIALEFEKKFTKEQILSMYLNQIYFGHGVYGVNSASRFFFERELKDLTIVEAALLAGIPSAPNHFSPLKNPRGAYEKNRQVIYNMISAGYITKEEASGQFDAFWKNYLESIKIKYQTLGVRNRSFDRAPFFTEYIRSILIDRFGENEVYRGGLSVYTTLDLRHQKAAEDALIRGVDEQDRIAGEQNHRQLDSFDRIIARRLLEAKKIGQRDVDTRVRFMSELRNGPLNDILMMTMVSGSTGIEEALDLYLDEYESVRVSSRVQGALLALDPATGGITAMVGGSDFSAANQLNRAVQSVRQPGSAFKAFVYGAGIESKRITPATAFYDVPVMFKGTRSVWKPSNYEKSYRGRVLVRNALAASLNIVSVLVVDEIDPKTVADYASRLMGIPISRFSIDPTISLGTSEVSPLEMARGFAVYATGGCDVRPHAIRYITNKKGRKIFDGESGGGPGNRVISEQTAFIMTSMLRSVVDSGTATGGIREAAGFSLPAAGKTGTTTNYKDAWFVGFTPDLVAAVWMGCDSPKFTLGGGQSAAVVSAPVWGSFMRDVYTFRKPGRFRERPSGITQADICAKTGKIPVEGCPVRTEYFITGTEPSEKCNSDHDEMISIFDLVRKRKNNLLDREMNKLENRGSEENPEKIIKTLP
jgi:penicillin-binding protein 1A